MLQKVKKFFLKENERENKLNKLLDSIDDIISTHDSTVIKFNKNVVVYSEGHQLFVSKKDIVIKSKLLHLNPKISIIDDAKTGKTNKAIKDIRTENNKMKGTTNEKLEVKDSNY